MGPTQLMKRAAAAAVEDLSRERHSANEKLTRPRMEGKRYDMKCRKWSVRKSKQKVNGLTTLSGGVRGGGCYLSQPEPGGITTDGPTQIDRSMQRPTVDVQQTPRDASDVMRDERMYAEVTARTVHLSAMRHWTGAKMGGVNTRGVACVVRSPLQICGLPPPQAKWFPPALFPLAQYAPHQLNCGSPVLSSL